MIYRDDGVNFIEVIHDYYPFGWEKTLTQDSYPSAYQGQLFDNDLGWQYYKYRNYDPQIARFHQVESLVGSFPMWSGYGYMNGVVTYGIEREGKDVEIFVRPMDITSGSLGHTFVVIRYGELGRDKGSLNSTDISGEGVLIKYTGDKALEYIQKEIEKGAEGYKIKDIDTEEEKLVMRYFEQKLKAAQKTYKVTKQEEREVVGKYNLFANNCTTQTFESLKDVNSFVKFVELLYTFAPNKLYLNLKRLDAINRLYKSIFGKELIGIENVIEQYWKMNFDNNISGEESKNIGAENGSNSKNNRLREDGETEAQ